MAAPLRTVIFVLGSQFCPTIVCCGELIDGEQCTPTPIKKVVANLGLLAASVRNEHRSVEIEGHCSDISAGNHIISLHVSACPNCANGDTHTGWGVCRQRFIMEEYHAGSNIAAVVSSDGQTLYRVPQLNMINHGADSPNSEVDMGIVWVIPDYNKYYSSSGLQVALSADGRCWWHANLDSNIFSACCRHYFVINGVECADPGTIEGIHSLNKNTSLHRPMLVEGICENIPAGAVTLTLNAGICKGYTKKGECYFGWNSYVHLLVSESFVDREIVQF